MLEVIGSCWFKIKVGMAINVGSRFKIEKNNQKTYIEEGYL